MFYRRVRWLGLIMLAVCPWPVEVPAQGASAADGNRGLGLSISAFSAYDDDVFGDQGSSDPSRAQVGGQYSGLTSGLVFRTQRRRLTFDGSATTSLRYYSEQARTDALAHSANVGLSAQVSSRTTVEGRAAGSNGPYFTLDTLTNLTRTGLDAVAVADSSNQAVVRRTILNYSGAVDVAHTLSRQSVLTVTAAVASADVSGAPLDASADSGAPSDTREYRLGTRLGRRFGRDTTVRIGYTHRRAEFEDTAGARPIRSHDVEVGIDREWRHSGLRRTALRLGIGPSFVEDQGRRLTQLIADAGVSHQLGRTWTAAAAYRRGVSVLEGYEELFFADSATIELDGWIGPRVELRTVAAYSEGEIGFNAVGNRFDTYTGTLTLRLALVQAAAIYGELRYSHFDFGAQVQLLSDLPRTLDQTSIVVGLTLWVPLRQER